MMKFLCLFCLYATVSIAADWTTVDPTVVSKLVQPHGADVVLEFTEDTPTPRTTEKRFSVFDLADLEDQAFQYQIQLGVTYSIPDS